MRHNLADAAQQALSFLLAQRSYIESGVYRIQYPDIQYKNLVPIEPTGNAWTKSVTYFSLDSFGKAAWFHAAAQDIPVADFSLASHEATVEMAAVGYEYRYDELMVLAGQPTINVTNERATAAVRAYEEFVDECVLRGDTTKGWQGLINRSDVTAVNAAAVGDENGGTNSPYFEHKTADQVLADINDCLTAMWTATLNIELADTVLLPYKALITLSQLRLPNLPITAMEWIKKANVYTLTTGQPLTILGVRGLETAAAGSHGRMVAYRRDPQVLRFYIPMTHQFLAPMQAKPLVWTVPGIFRLGGLDLRRPAAVRYLDLVCA